MTVLSFEKPDDLLRDLARGLERVGLSRKPWLNVASIG